VLHDLLAVLFGLGCGLVLDEFAPVLHLEDVYWKEEGRRSVDAVILAVAVIGLLVAGEAPLGGYVGGRSYTSYVVAAVLLGFVVLCLLKGKVWTGLLGVMVPLLAVVGALRLARPHSPWARWRYTARPRRMARAERREEGARRRVMAAKTAVMDAVAGAPTPVSLAKKPTALPTVVEVPPSRLELVLARVLRPVRGPGAVVAVWYLRLAAVVNVVAALVPPLRDQVRVADNGEYVSAFLVSPGFTGAALAFVLSVGLRRRKRAAWIVTTVAAGAYTVGIAIAVGVMSGAQRHPFNWVSIALSALLLAALLVSRTAFNVRGERRNAALGLVSLVVGAVVAVGAGTLLTYATDQDPPGRWGPSARYATVRMLTLSGLFSHPGIRVPWWADLLINVISTALLLLVVLAFLRAPRNRARLQPADERQLRALLRADDGRDSFGYFALRRDRAVCWSPDRRAAIVHRVVNGVALASGDPLGPPGAWPAAVAHWLDTARRHAWVAAVAHAGDGATGVYTAAGLHGVDSGVEPVIEVGPLPDGPAEVRRVMAAAGYGVVLRRQREVDESEWVRLRQLAEAWRRHGRAAAGAGLGRLGDPADPQCVVAECRDRHDRTCALLVFVPWGEDGLTLETLRHDQESGHGPVDLALTEVLLRAYGGADPVAGITRVSLNLAPGDAGQAYAPYRPRLSARHLLYERRTELPRVVAAAAYTEGLRAGTARNARSSHRGNDDDGNSGNSGSDGSRDDREARDDRRAS
jgi:lysyl-tRNA synthetase class 2